MGYGVLVRTMNNQNVTTNKILRRPSPTLNTDELRDSFLQFYAQRAHLIFPSSSLIPHGDPTLLLVNSGMAQFKSYFSGEKRPPQPRITTSQKCFRGTDIDAIGDSSHLTLFEMLGNFSFGDYFKEEACEWAWDLMVNVLEFPAERLFITVHDTDEEAESIWLQLGIPADKIYRFGATDNWWGPAGTEGPCGPCSEIHYYSGDAIIPNADRTKWGPNIHPDFLELYNLVFTQFYRDEQGRDTPLPQRNIDTGLGLERSLTALHNAQSVYEVGVLRQIHDATQSVSHALPNNRDTEGALRVVTDHGRAAAFLISDGVVPGNTGRGYVLRRLIRRAILFARRTGMSDRSLVTSATATAEVMGGVYSELRDNLSFIPKMLQREAEAFERVLDFGSSALSGMSNFRKAYDHFKKIDVTLLSTGASNNSPLTLDALGIVKPHGEDAVAIGQLAAYNALNKKLHSSPGSVQERLQQFTIVLSGEETFLLHDTYGLPVDIACEFVKEYGFTGVDQAGFEHLLQEHRDAARMLLKKKTNSETQAKIYGSIKSSATHFLGYFTTNAWGKVVALLHNGKLVKSGKPGQNIEIILDRTPFYAQRGGQIGDTGVIKGEKDLSISVIDTKSPYGGLIVHYAKIVTGTVHTDQKVIATVDKEWREKLRRNHTATHLLHASLREIIGVHVRQSGSVVHPDYLRFDFTHFAPLRYEEVRDVQERVATRIRENLAVEVRWTTYAEAIEGGALAFFDDTYENDVRTIRIDGEWSYELCGGTHMNSTGGIGPFVLTTESGIGTGLRRLVALTGIAAGEEIWRRFSILDSLAHKFSTPVDGVENKIAAMLEDSSQLKTQVRDMEDSLVRATLQGGGSSQRVSFNMVKTDKPFAVEISEVPASNMDALRRAGDQVRTRLGSGVVVLGSKANGRAMLVVMATKDLAKTTIHCGEIAKSLADVLNGGGGGRPDLGQVGGKDANLLHSGLAKAEQLLRGMGEVVK